jgi:hypothetical protein
MKPVLRLALILSASLCGCVGGPPIPLETTEFHFGLLVGTWPDLIVTKETLVIPKRTDTELSYYGFSIASAGRPSFTVNTVVFPPGPPARVGGIAFGNPADYQKGFVSTTAHSTRGRVVIGFRFNEGDPLGSYRLDVIVNGKPWKTVNYAIVE